MLRPIGSLNALVWKHSTRQHTFIRPTALLLARTYVNFTPRTSSLRSTPVSPLSIKWYSTKTAPPPPPPPSSTPSDKNAKGKAILSKISRAITFSASTLLVLGAAGVAVIVLYLITSELFFPSGDTRTFNKAVKLVEQNEEAQKALNFKNGDRLKAYGEVAGDRWVRNRPVQSSRHIGKDGKEYLIMKFHVESDSGHHGSVLLEQIDSSFWSTEFAYIALDLYDPSAKQKRVYIIPPKIAKPKTVINPMSGNDGFLGLKWGPKKD
ncbi:mitochondrial import inner membrane translocase subunit tim21 [Scheffersomyces spartinae]|uniref:Mitochondrial import inner membrane translocase subunit Tim21 n=1 Tax=Scheffersomyces spartinae TaxID=45513 RepID=A0A9P7VDB5_9ASCO|nr:mitochondrial import inner membrane translocase subunit tim21 [Scheffersomyces spartinae]KAG7196030.1 mitochondrial import inner membrane translocase subunit tim21 [Scheffersomyces spartinae]